MTQLANPRFYRTYKQCSKNSGLNLVCFQYMVIFLNSNWFILSYAKVDPNRTFNFNGRWKKLNILQHLFGLIAREIWIANRKRSMHKNMKKITKEYTICNINYNFYDILYSIHRIISRIIRSFQTIIKFWNWFMRVF